jgi:hypothetical protein
MALLLALGCGSEAPEQRQRGQWIGVLPENPMPHTQYRADGCEEVDDFEAPHVGKPGYDYDGCTKSDRMAQVAPFEDDYSGKPEASGDIGELQQPITVLQGTGSATPISVNSSQQITGFLPGGCPVLNGWTTAMPLRGNCLIPNRVAALNYKVCPSCYNSDNAGYVNARMIAAWGAWSRPITCGGVTVTPQLKDGTLAELFSFPTPQENYDNARILVYPVSGIFAAARMSVDKDFIVGKTPIRNGVRYWGWDYAALEIDHQVVESVKLPACVSETDPKLAQKLKNGYIWILTHELGHAWGMMHTDTGVMRRGPATPCSQVFAEGSTPPVLAAMTVNERMIAASIRDSGGFSVIPPTLPDTPTCNPAGVTVPGVPDDMAVVNF